MASSDDDRVGVKVVALAHADCEIRRRIAAGEVQQAGFGIEREGSPEAATADRYARQVFPRRRVERALAEGSANHVAFDLGHHEELPEDLAGLGVERVHLSLAALEVATRVANVDDAVVRDGRRRHRLAMFRVRDGRFPNSLAGLEVIGEHPAVRGAAKQHAVQVGGAAVGGQKAGG